MNLKCKDNCSNKNLKCAKLETTTFCTYYYLDIKLMYSVMIQFEVYKRTQWELQVNRRNTEIILVYLLELSIDAHTRVG